MTEDMRVDRRVRNATQNLLHDAGERRFADPAESKTRQRDPKLNPVHHLVQILVQSQDSARTNSARFNQLLNARVAHAHQGKFGGGKKRVGCHQEQDQHDPEQHESHHG